jgi:uncharacterized SAM-dependent methyltransferase
VHLGDACFNFRPNERITTEFSYKHSPEGFIALAGAAGFRFRRLWIDDERLFGLFLFDR